MDLTNLNSGERKNRRKSSSMDLGTMMYGKVPPQAKDLEEAVLGAIMLDKSAFDIVSEILKPECFYVEANQRIFRSMQGLMQKNLPIDLLTVVEELKTREELDVVGGPYYVSKLTNSVVSAANIEAHSRIIIQKFIQRELIRISGEIIGDAYEDSTDVFELLDEAENKLFKITNDHLKKSFTQIDTVLVKTIQRIEDIRQNPEAFTGVPSGFELIDRITWGWQPTDLIILAARPAVGKTAFALNLARNAALHEFKPTPVGFFSLEMSAGQLVARMLSAESEIWLEKISRGRLEEHEMKILYKKGIERLASAPIFIDDTAALNIFELRAKARRMKSKHKVGMIIVDYLQLMSGTSEDKYSNREQQISRISRDLKGLAKELDIPIIALSQLSREVEKRGANNQGQKMPQLSDLRESGALEQDADMVMFLYRPEYYDITANEYGESNAGETHVRIAKHRNGVLDTIKLKALLHIQKFTNYDEPINIDPRDSYVKQSEHQNTQFPYEPGNRPKGYIQKGSKMNDESDPDPDDDTPF